ncbi:glucosaminidase domain-containing protein [Alicyclobacillus tolerans]|uniref:Beta-N-acetylglucosaminidase n=1 Tax=Alicyclobacillus tolerans TaxID=90970 RepID=A0ABT9LWE3_9BACL|nr:glucosaminidase domain-containing protein [Alicyclobacillus tengchongensis]MDP9728594.1 beta-N-acetylglucosaminidase [Alicyclobacillus tengchongensis]
MFFALTGTPIVEAATPNYTMSKKSIIVNGQTVEQPYGFVYQQTTYMPLYYVMQALKPLGFVSQWNGHLWTITSSSHFHPSILPPQNHATDSLILNETPLEHFPTLVAIDPDSGEPTTYIPIWYIQQALTAIGIQSKWNGTTWTMTFNVNPAASIPEYAAYQSPTSQPVDYTSFIQAEAAVQSSNVGYVVNTSTNQVVVWPKDDWSLMDDQYFAASFLPGYSFPAPSFAVPGATYVSLNAVQGSTPNDTVFYQIAENGTYIDKWAGNYEDPYRQVDLRTPAPAGLTANKINAFLQSVVPNSGLQGLGQAILQAAQTYGVNATYLLAHAILESNWGTNSLATEKNNLYGYGAYDADPFADGGVFPSKTYTIQFQAWFVRNTYLNPGGPEYYEFPTLDGMNQNYATDPTWSLQIGELMRMISQFAGLHLSQYTLYQPGSASPPEPDSNEPVFSFNGASAMLKSATTSSLIPIYSNPDTELTSFDNTPTGNWISGMQVQVLQMEQGFWQGYVTAWYKIQSSNHTGWVMGQNLQFNNIYQLNSKANQPIPVYSNAQANSTLETTLHTGSWVVMPSYNAASQDMLLIDYVNPLTGTPETGYIESQNITVNKVAQNSANA